MKGHALPIDNLPSVRAPLKLVPLRQLRDTLLWEILSAPHTRRYLIIQAHRYYKCTESELCFASNLQDQGRRSQDPRTW